MYKLHYNYSTCPKVARTIFTKKLAV